MTADLPGSALTLAAPPRPAKLLQARLARLGPGAGPAIGQASRGTPPARRRWQSSGIFW
jgi:hypothetical protein